MSGVNSCRRLCEHLCEVKVWTLTGQKDFLHLGLSFMMILPPPCWPTCSCFRHTKTELTVVFVHSWDFDEYLIHFMAKSFRYGKVERFHILVYSTAQDKNSVKQLRGWISVLLNELLLCVETTWLFVMLSWCHGFPLKKSSSLCIQTSSHWFLFLCPKRCEKRG